MYTLWTGFLFPSVVIMCFCQTSTQTVFFPHLLHSLSSLLSLRESITVCMFISFTVYLCFSDTSTCPLTFLPPACDSISSPLRGFPSSVFVEAQTCFVAFLLIPEIRRKSSRCSKPSNHSSHLQSSRSCSLTAVLLVGGTSEQIKTGWD